MSHRIPGWYNDHFCATTGYWVLTFMAPDKLPSSSKGGRVGRAEVVQCRRWCNYASAGGLMQCDLLSTRSPKSWLCDIGISSSSVHSACNLYFASSFWGGRKGKKEKHVRNNTIFVHPSLRRFMITVPKVVVCDPKLNLELPISCEIAVFCASFPLYLRVLVSSAEYVSWLSLYHGPHNKG